MDIVSLVHGSLAADDRERQADSTKRNGRTIFIPRLTVKVSWRSDYSSPYKPRVFGGPSEAIRGGSEPPPEALATLELVPRSGTCGSTETAETAETAEAEET